MDRRSFLGALAGLPFIDGLVKGKGHQPSRSTHYIVKKFYSLCSLLEYAVIYSEKKLSEKIECVYIGHDAHKSIRKENRFDYSYSQPNKYGGSYRLLYGPLLTYFDPPLTGVEGSWFLYAVSAQGCVDYEIRPSGSRESGRTYILEHIVTYCPL